VFGENSVRGPDGNIIEQGIRWPGSSPEALAGPSGGSASPDNPAASAPSEQRTIDARLVHPFAERVQ